MDGEKIMAFLREYWQVVTLAMGVLLMIGTIRNWNWFCDPTGAPDSRRYGRGSRRVIFFLMGMVLIVVSIWSFVVVLK